ncbi:hypothetical protein PV04_00689 [Phialophora macrospora]|uniref:Uncharacterized protein n=1 Tax=Phialophora macrospora TaxID=1851006 RepID=A0A0D2GJJ0_9EURO|nr:hypothetical protein PV04_00689 [Phialophora macrospora]
MSLLPYWLGLRPMTYTSYIKIRGGGQKKSPTPSTYLDESSDSEGSGSTMEVYCKQELEGTEDPRGVYYEALEDLDAPPEELFEEPNPHVVRRDLRIQEARQNRKRMEELREEAVLKAKNDIDKTSATGSRAFSPRTYALKTQKRGNKGRKKQRAQETPNPVLSPSPSDHALPRGALDEQQQQARQARNLQASPTPLASCSVSGRRQPHQHDGRRLMTHARDRGHHRSFAPTAPSAPSLLNPSSPDRTATARPHNASSFPTTREPLSLWSPRMPLTRGIYGTGHTDPSTSATPTSPLESPRPHTETVEVERRKDRGRRSQAPSPTPRHQQLQEQTRQQQQQKEMKVEHMSEEIEALSDPDLHDICWERNLLRRIVMQWLGIDASQYWKWLRDEERRLNEDERGA